MRGCVKVMMRGWQCGSGVEGDEAALKDDGDGADEEALVVDEERGGYDR
jgi:hypothetical protein